jgi:hypothetical protein
MQVHAAAPALSSIVHTLQNPSHNAPSSDDLEQYGKQNIQQVLAYETQSHWINVKKVDGIEVDRAIVGNSAWQSIKATATVECSAENLAQQLTTADEMPRFDTMTSSCVVLNQVTPHTSVRYVQAKPVFPTTARDFLVVTSEHRSGSNEIVIASRSIEFDEIMPLQPNFVRATMYISGYVLRALSPTQCHVTLIVHMDLGGYLPASVLNMLSTAAPIKLLKQLQTTYRVA